MQRHIDVFEGHAGHDAAEAVRRLDKIVAGLAGVFAAEDVSKNQRLGELTGAHQKAGVVDGPWTFNVPHTSPLRGGLLELRVAGREFLVASFWFLLF